MRVCRSGRIEEDEPYPCCETVVGPMPVSGRRSTRGSLHEQLSVRSFEEIAETDEEYEQTEEQEEAYASTAGQSSGVWSSRSASLVSSASLSHASSSILPPYDRFSLFCRKSRSLAVSSDSSPAKVANVLCDRQTDRCGSMSGNVVPPSGRVIRRGFSEPILLRHRPHRNMASFEEEEDCNDEMATGAATTQLTPIPETLTPVSPLPLELQQSLERANCLYSENDENKQ